MADGLSFAMSSIEIESSQGNYWVHFSSGVADLEDSNYFYIIDRAVAGNRVLERLDASRTILVDGSEKTKTIEFCSELIS